jgi:hypothetical protein
VISDQKLPMEKWEREGSYLFLLTFPVAAFHAALK